MHLIFPEVPVSTSGEACGLIVGTSTWCLVAILKSTLTLWHLSQNSEWHLNDILSLSNINSMLWIVFSVFWSFRVAPRSGTNAEWYQGPGPISISWISSPFSWNLHMKVQRREKTMLPNRLSHHPDELKLMAWRTSEINDWNQFLGVSWKGSTSTSKWRHPIQKSTLQWMKAETPVDCFQSSCLYDPSWRSFPRCNLCTSVYCDTIKSSSYFSRCPRPITSPPLSGAVGSSSAAGSVWRNGGSSSAGVDSAPGLARGDALICLPWTRTVMRWCSLPIFALSRYLRAMQTKSCPVTL